MSPGKILTGTAGRGLGHAGEPAGVATSYRSRTRCVLPATDTRTVRTVAKGIVGEAVYVEFARCVTAAVRSGSGEFCLVI
jgi:hypothetical protein